MVNLGAKTGAILAIWSMAAMPVLAQDTGGVLLNFGVSQNVSVIDNAGLTTPSSGTTTRATTDLSFGLSSVTRTSSLALTGSTALIAVNRPGGDGFETTMDEPRFALAYTRQAAASRLNARVSYTQQDITFIDPLDDFRDEDGNVILTEDFIDLSGSGTRQSLRYSASLSIRDNRPFGLTFSASVVDLNYVDVTTPELTDSTSTTLGVDGRFDINDVTRLNLGITRVHLDTADGDFEQLTADSNLTIERPDGTVGFGLTATETTNGTRFALSFSRNYSLPGDVGLATSLGLTTATDSDDLFVTGTLRYSRPLPNGSVNASLTRSFATDTDGDEELQTSLSLGATHALTPLATLNLSAAYARAEVTATEQTSELTSLGASISYSLTPDWSLNAGYSFETRDTNTSDRVARNSLSVTLAREFSFRP